MGNEYSVVKYDSYKKLCELKKPHSPITILFCTEDFPDEWLIDVVEYRTKTGIITEEYMITSKELDGYIQFCGKDGFTKLTKF